MSSWNYVATTHKPTKVNRSCVGHFTGPQDLNLIIAKGCRIEIHLFTRGVLQLMLDVPIYRRITTLQLFRPRHATQDLLFISARGYKICVLQWDANSSKVVIRQMADVKPNPEEVGLSEHKIGIIDPLGRLIVMHQYVNNDCLQVIPLDYYGQLQEPFDYRVDDQHVLDVKFLFGCLAPTMAVLDNPRQHDCGARLTTYTFFSQHGEFRGIETWCHNLDDGAKMLIPVPSPLHGVLVIGQKNIVYCALGAIAEIPIHFTTKAYACEDARNYFLSDDNGGLHRLVIKDDKVKGARDKYLELQTLGKTSRSSTISHLEKGFIYVGSKYGQSQLINIRPFTHSNESFVDVRKRYVSLAPISDFCVVDHERRQQVVTCSGGFEDRSLHVIHIGINGQASVKLQDIVVGMWSLRSSFFDTFDTFLVVSFISKTRILAMTDGHKMEETEIEGFCSEVQTLFCQNAIFEQLVQITASSVRLVSSVTKEFQTEWRAPSGYSISVATANASQVLVAAGGGRLIFLQIGKGILEQGKCLDLDYEISCLDINPIGINPNSSEIAAVGMSTDISVGMSTDISVGIFSIPELKLLTKEQLGGEIYPHSILLCIFDEILYLLCADGYGRLLNFRLSRDFYNLTNRNEVSLGIQPITLRIFSSDSRIRPITFGTSSSESVTRVFAVSDRPYVIYSSNKKLLCSNVNLKEVSHMCPFNSADFPDCLAIARKCELTIGTIDDIQKPRVRTIQLSEHAEHICHQEQSRSFAIITLQNNKSSAEEPKLYFVRLLDDQTFDILSSYALDASETSRCILSCSFADDEGAYYCVGTKYAGSEEKGEPKGRILVLKVGKNKKLRLIYVEKTGYVFSLIAFNGKLLAKINEKIQLFKWTLRDGTRQLKSEWLHQENDVLDVKTYGDYIAACCFTAESESVVIYKHEEGAIVEQARDNNISWEAIEILDDELYLGADYDGNLVTLKEKEEEGFEVVGQYHVGDRIHKFWHGSRVARPDYEIGKISTVIFSTKSGAIGVVASLSQDQYLFLDKLQSIVRSVTKSSGGLSFEQWRSCKEENAYAKGFLDGDLIESFLDLSGSQMEEISYLMDIPVKEMYEKVKKLTELH